MATTMVRTLGSGPPLVMIPGVDGHCTWLQPVLDELSRHFTVITFSLWGERDSGHRFDESRGFEPYLAQVDEALRQAGVERVMLCGVSYGGWVALSYAARHPGRVDALVLVSTPPPAFQPNTRQQRYLGSPILSAPVFVLTAPGRIAPEIFAVLPTWSERVRFGATHLARVARTGLSPTRMAARMRVAKNVDFFEACRCITMPTLVVTGEPGLDRVVPVEQTWKYLKLIPGSESLRLRGGHVCCLTQPRVFANALESWRRGWRDRDDERDSGTGGTPRSAA
jgi:pimeloyl-ACP methyl ester carboxylesterase